MVVESRKSLWADSCAVSGPVESSLSDGPLSLLGNVFCVRISRSCLNDLPVDRVPVSICCVVAGMYSVNDDWAGSLQFEQTALERNLLSLPPDTNSTEAKRE